MVFGDPNSTPDDFNRPRDRKSFFEDLRTMELQRDFDEERRDLERADALQRRDDERRMSAEAEQRMLEAIVDLSPADIRDLINDAMLKVTPMGTISSRSRPSGRDTIRRSGQFSRANILPRLKKPRKKNKKHCKNLSQCLRQANAELRTKKGAIRKGKTQADIMRRAQKLLRKMS
tara:strand:+ start:565 stop:1089 length:525 start_codon:yes stop_codon:yes gene_type:complete